ncbi:MAG: dihydroorotate dehydrogenase (quinone) [Bacteriovorax sp. MedPE-SWde]|nr:MAG: dihydroorotate dehydrogenase (quinone) [Bacteriovorax sp. MedPE-SWde]
MLYKIFKPIAFSLDPEFVHDQTIDFCSKHPHWAKFIGRKDLTQDLSLKVGNLKWDFPVGLAAGLDKNGQCYDFFSSLGFGAVEIGTVTPLAQPGNPRPRLFRYKNEQSLRNCMGFNNGGAQLMHDNISRIKCKGPPLGINIGKNKITPDETAFEDYVSLYDQFKAEADYIVVNVSSPNTPGLREHQSKMGLESILSQLNRRESDCDLFVKISPDIDLDSVNDIVECVGKYGATGIIATNTTIMKDRGVGGISGKLLFDKSQKIRQKCLDATASSDIELIGVGGFSNFDQIENYWRCGGRSLQIYSSFIFQGPQILSDIQSRIVGLMEKYRTQNLEELLLILKEEK